MLLYSQHFAKIEKADFIVIENKNAKDFQGTIIRMKKFIMLNNNLIFFIVNDILVKELVDQSAEQLNLSAQFTVQFIVQVLTTPV